MCNYETSGIIYTQISDHFPVFSSFSLPNNINSEPSYVTYRKRLYNDDSINSFKSALSNFKWEDLLTGQDVNNDFDIYMNTFTQLYNRYFYVREYKVKKEHTSKPYITEGIRKSIKHRNKLQKLSAKWPLTYEKEFKRYRNMLTSIIKTAKDSYYKSTLKDNAGNPSKTWQIINDILKRKN